MREFSVLDVVLEKIINENKFHIAEIVTDITKRRVVEMKLTKQSSEMTLLNEEYISQNEEIQAINDQLTIRNKQLLINESLLTVTKLRHKS